VAGTVVVVAGRVEAVVVAAVPAAPLLVAEQPVMSKASPTTAARARYGGRHHDQSEGVASTSATASLRQPLDWSMTTGTQATERLPAVPVTKGGRVERPRRVAPCGAGEAQDEDAT